MCDRLYIRKALEVMNPSGDYVVVDETKVEELWLNLDELKKENVKLKERLEISPYGDDNIDALEQALQFAKHEINIQKQEVSELKDKIIELTNIWIK